MTRANQIVVIGLLILGWAVGTLLSIASTSSDLGLLVNGVGSVGALITVTALLRRAPAAAAWSGIVIAAAAFVAGAVVAPDPIWPAGVCWAFVIAAGLAAAQADTAADGALEAVAALLAVLPVVPVALQDTGMWLIAVLAAGAVYVSIMFGHKHRTAERRLEQTRSEVQMTERTAMARELHDVIAHEVTGIVVLAQAGIAAGADADGTLARIERSGSRALADIRAMVGTLREPGEAPPPLAPSASGSELSASLGELAQTGVDVTVDPAVDTDDVPDLVRLVAHRVVAEGLTNARRHAPGSTVRVTVGRVDGDLRVDVVDDGASADAPPGPGPGGGTGLIGLAERAATVGGTVTSGPDGPEGAGWRLTAHLPIDGGS